MWLAISAGAQAQPTTLDDEFYAKFPNHGHSSSLAPVEPAGIPPGTFAGLQHFHEMLAGMRKARDDLRSECAGEGWRRMVASVRGTQVLIWPERFRECERRALLLDKGNGLYQVPLIQWNKTFGATYLLPKGDPADVQAWAKRKEEFLHFSQPGCDEASRAIVLSGQPGITEPSAKVFEKAKKTCPASWIRLFEPQEEIDKRALAAKRVCRPDTTYMVVDELSGNGARETCDDSDRYIPPPPGPKLSISALQERGLESELEALGRGEYESALASAFLEDVTRILASRRQLSASAAEALRRQLADQPKAGWVGGVEIFGGRTGKLLEALLNPAQAADALAELQSEADLSSSDMTVGAGAGGCDDADYARRASQFLSTRVPGISQLSIEPQQCAMARLYLEGIQRDLAYAAQCKPAAMPSLERARADMKDQERNLCNAGAGGSASNRNTSRAPTTCFEAMVARKNTDLCRPTIIPGRK